MNSSEIFGIIENIRNTSSTNDKTSLVASHIPNDEFKKVLQYCVDPTLIYGLVPESSWADNTTGTSEFDITTWSLLNDLINRVLTGNAAKDALRNHIATLNKESAQLLIRIIRKDFRAGFSEKIINKTCKGLIPEYSYMRCSLPKGSKIKEFPWKDGVYSEVKMDGLFLNANWLEDLHFTSRAGSVFPTEPFSDIKDSVSLEDFYEQQTHGELLVEENGQYLPRKTGNGILNSVSQGGSFGPGQKPVYVVWDIIPIEFAKKKGKYKVPYKDRLAKLESIVGKDNPHIRVVEYEVLHSYKECIEHSMRMIKSGKEGTVIKHPDMIWEDGTSKYQVKIKVEFDCDLEIVSIQPGKVDTKLEGRPGAFLLKSSCGKLKVKAVIKNDAMRDLVEKDPEDWIGRIIEVTGNELMESTDTADEYSLYLPRLSIDYYRADKLVADDVDRIKEIVENYILMVEL